MSLADQVKTTGVFWFRRWHAWLAFRREQLKKLSAAICKYEEEAAGLYIQTSEKESPKESWATERTYPGLRYGIPAYSRAFIPWWAYAPTQVNQPGEPSIIQWSQAWTHAGLLLIVGPGTTLSYSYCRPLFLPWLPGNCVVLQVARNKRLSAAASWKDRISETFVADYIL